MIAGPPLLLRQSTFVASVLEQAERRPDRDAVLFLGDGERVTARLGFAAAAERMERIATGLAACGLVGRPVLLCLPPGVDFVAALLGCFRAGAIAVPIPYPTGADARRTRLDAIIASLGAAVVLTDAATAANPAVIDGFVSLPRLLIEEAEETGTPPPMPRPSDPALIQYSSGSTREPRGIVITHGNLAANQAMIGDVMETDERDRGMNWLPPWHDMGLIGTTLHGLARGFPVELMPADSFIRKPLRWLRAISEHRATIAGGPNFAFDLCVRRVRPEMVATLDLSSWRVAFCGAEPVRAETLRRFADHFRPAGFDPSAFLPCYGLAEATLIVSGARRGRGLVEHVPPPGVAAFSQVSCGGPVPGCAIALRPVEGFPAPLGEIGVAGPHVAPGTWDGASARVEPFADTFDGPDGGTYLATGDIGAIVDGALLVVDRLKDVVVVHGRKVHAVDIERAALDIEPRLAAAAAFAVPATPDAPERAILLCELAGAGLAQVDEARRWSIARGVSERTGLAPVIGFLRYGALPRTTSGKIRRHAARAAFLAGTLGAVGG